MFLKFVVQAIPPPPPLNFCFTICLVASSNKWKRIVAKCVWNVKFRCPKRILNFSHPFLYNPKIILKKWKEAAPFLTCKICPFNCEILSLWSKKKIECSKCSISKLIIPFFEFILILKYNFQSVNFSVWIFEKFHVWHLYLSTKGYFLFSR